MAYSELHLLDGSTLLDHRQNVGQQQLEQAMNHWLDSGTSPLLATRSRLLVNNRG